MTNVYGFLATKLDRMVDHYLSLAGNNDFITIKSLDKYWLYILYISLITTKLEQTTQACIAASQQAIMKIAPLGHVTNINAFISTFTSLVTIKIKTNRH